MKIIIAILLTTSYLFSSIDINSATAEELLDLNGIGKAKAAKIVKYRESKECFESVDELANIDGISKKLVLKNKDNITLGKCNKITSNDIKKSAVSTQAFKEVLLDPVNLCFVIVIFILAFIDQRYKKDLKSQIVSVGVLGTFVGIFIGLQGFDPEDIINSVNQILVGLKTAFFTSIVGMGVATILSLYQKLKGSSETK